MQWWEYSLWEPRGTMKLRYFVFEAKREVYLIMLSYAQVPWQHIDNAAARPLVLPTFCALCSLVRLSSLITAAYFCNKMSFLSKDEQPL